MFRSVLRNVRTFSSTASRYYDRATTILCVRKGDQVVMMGDGQVSRGSTVVKPNARKIRRIGNNGNVIAGFAGSTADCLTLLDRLESNLEKYPEQLLRASVETAKAWRTDKYLRQLEALMIVADSGVSLTLTGNGDVFESTDGVIGIGSGGDYALAAARALYQNTELSAAEITKSAMTIAADLCVYTNHNFVTETLNNVETGNKS